MSENMYLFKKNKYKDNDRSVAFSKSGKVIIAEKPVETGYYKVGSIKDFPTYVIASSLSPVYYDVYYGMGYSQFKELLLSRGYKISFEMPFEYTYPSNGVTTREKRLVAFSRELNMVIVADSINEGKSLHDINCYCYGVSGYGWRTRMFSHGSKNLTVMNLVYASLARDAVPPLHSVEGICCRDEKVSINTSDLPRPFTYAENHLSRAMTVEEYKSYAMRFKEFCSDDLREYLYGGK